MRTDIIELNDVVYLNETEIDELMVKYKYSPSDKNLIRGVYYSLEPLIRLKITYSVELNDDLINYKNGCDKYAFAAISLGNYIDEFAKVYLDAGEVLIPNIINNIGMEILAKSYSILAGDISSRFGLWTKKYVFPGDDSLELDSSKDIIRLLNVKYLTCNKACVLEPAMSVTMKLLLSDINHGKIHFCDMCKNFNCVYRSK